MYKLHWTTLTVYNSPDQKHILKQVTGYVKSGTFLTIMGPSGAGKSTLLSLITARLRKNNTNLVLSGSIQLNAQDYDLNTFSKIAAYVQQDDMLLGTLTVRQTFQFHAKLKLWDILEQQQKNTCDKLLKKLNLTECSQTLIGNNQFKKCISGGQKKRVAIGVELLSNPSILIFDEPTSGLDSHNAFIITQLLKDLAKRQNKLVIATIHQPSTRMFQSMDQLYLLKSGECVYHGCASNIIQYIQNLNIKVNIRMNPADFFMLQLSSYKQAQGYISPLNKQNFNKKYKVPQQFYQQPREQLNKQIHQITPYFQQFKPLIQRSFKNFIRLPSNQLNKLVTAIMIPLFLGIMYIHYGLDVPLFPNTQYIQDLVSFLFMGLYFVFAMNVYDTCLVFPEQKQLLFKEVGSNLYSISAYFFSRLITQILGCIIPAVICAILVYLMVDFDLSSTHFSYFIGIYVALSLCGYLFGLMFGVLCKDSSAAINLLPMALIPILIFGGLVVKLTDIPEYISWFKFLSPLRCALILVFKDQLQSSNFKHFKPYNLLSLLGLDEDKDIVILNFILQGISCFILSLALLYIFKKRI